jgi:ribose transport system substrate-binding protein
LKLIRCGQIQAVLSHFSLFLGAAVMTRRLSALLALLLLAVVVVGWYWTRVFDENSPSSPPNIVVVTGGSNPYWQIIGNGARAAGKELDVAVDVRMPEKDEDVQAQSQILFGLDLEKIDGVAISPLDAEEQTRRINQLADAVFVVTIDSDAPLSNRLSYVGSGNVTAGQQSAQLVKEAIPNGGKVAVLIANLTKNNTQERKQGFDETLAQAPTNPQEPAPKYEVIQYLIDEGDKQRCESQLRQLLAAHDDLACIVGMNAYHGPILLKVLKDEQRLGQTKLVTFDTIDDTLAGVEAGEIYATIAQDPYEFGYQAIRLLSSYCRRRDQQTLPVPGVQSTMSIRTMAVRKDDVDEFRRSFRGRLESDAEKTEATPAR